MEDTGCRRHSRQRIDLDDDGLGPQVVIYPDKGINAGISGHAEDACCFFQITLDLGDNGLILLAVPSQSGRGNILSLAG